MWIKLSSPELSKYLLRQPNDFDTFNICNSDIPLLLPFRIS